MKGKKPGDVPGSGCSCTISSCSSTPSQSNPLKQAGCLDAKATLDEVKSLRAQDVRVLVIGFGADLNSVEAVTTLNAMAEAGAFARTCTASVDCGQGDGCDGSGLCGRRYFPAHNATELTSALNQIAAAVDPNACVFTLRESPDDASAIHVMVDDQTIPFDANSWTYGVVNGAPSVTFIGDLCKRVMASSEAAPLHVKIDLTTH